MKNWENALVVRPCKDENSVAELAQYQIHVWSYPRLDKNNNMLDELYTPHRTKYFAPYKYGKMYAVFEIICAVNVKMKEGKPEVDWPVIYTNDEEMPKEEINSRVNKFFSEDNPHNRSEDFSNSRWLLEDKGMNLLLLKHRVDISSDKGDLRGTKYCWDVAEGLKTSQELADKINGKSLEEFC